MFLKIVNTNEARPENQVRYEAIKVLSIESHQGQAFEFFPMNNVPVRISGTTGSRISGNGSICVTNPEPPAGIDENNFEQLKQNDIPQDYVDMVTFLDSQGQKKSILYGTYEKKASDAHNSKVVTINKDFFDKHSITLLTPQAFAAHAHQTRSNLSERINQLVGQLETIQAMWMGNLNALVEKALNTTVVQ